MHESVETTVSVQYATVILSVGIAPIFLRKRFALIEICVNRCAAFLAQDHFVAGWHVHCISITMQSVQFPNLGYVRSSVVDSQLQGLKSWINTISEDTTTINHSHVGTIAREYEIEDESAKQELSNILGPMVQQYCTDMHFTVEQRPMALTKAWCNLQTSGEYFAAHTHVGVFSFALWVQVPFTQADERAWREARGKSGRETASFQFHYTDALGRITPNVLEVDRSWENEIVVFPGEMMHSVTPYYSTDDTRIVVSGNVDYVG